MPTDAWLARFRADFERLTPAQQAAFLLAVGQFVEDLRWCTIRAARAVILGPDLQIGARDRAEWQHAAVARARSGVAPVTEPHPAAPLLVEWDVSCARPERGMT